MFDKARLELWEVLTARPRATLPGHQHSVAAVAFSPDGTLLASGSWDETVRLWDLRSGKVKAILRGHTEFVSAVAFSPDGKLLASGSWDYTIKLWDVARGKLKATLKRRTYLSRAVAFSTDGRTLAAAGGDPPRGAKPLEEARLLPGDGGRQGQPLLRARASRPPDLWAAAGALPHRALRPALPRPRTVRRRIPKAQRHTGTILLWDVATGKCRATLRQENWVSALAFSPDGKTLAAGDDNGTVCLWDAGTLKKRTTFAWQRGAAATEAWPCGNLAFSPDSKYLASCGRAGFADSEAWLWDLAASKHVVTLRGHWGGKCVAFSPDGRLLADDSGGSIRLWDVPTVLKAKK
jgi:WD40 repeat protein